MEIRGGRMERRKDQDYGKKLFNPSTYVGIEKIF